MDASFFDSSTYTYIVLPLLIFFARICDVTIGTLRIVFVSKGDKVIAPILGFFEVFIWIIAIGQIMGNLNNFYCYFAYAGGFATGNYIGLKVEERLAMGSLIVRIIVSKEGSTLIKKLNAAGFGATLMDAEGGSGKVQIIYCIIKRTDLPNVLNVINDFNPKAFYSIEDIKKVSAGIFPVKSSLPGINPLRRWRKGK